MSKKSVHFLMVVLTIIVASAFAGCGHKKKSNLLWLAFMGNGGPAVSPANAGDGSTPAVSGPAVQAPSPPADPVPPADPAPVTAITDNDPDLNCTRTGANDPTPPSVLKTLPADGQTSVGVDETVTIYFKNPIQCSSVQQIIRSSTPGAPIESISNLSSIMLYEEEAGGLFPGLPNLVELGPDYYRNGPLVLSEMACKCNRVRLKPLTPLLPDRSYWVVLGKTILSENNVPFPGLFPLSWSKTGYFWAHFPDFNQAEAQGNLTHFSTSADCPTISGLDDPAFDTTPLKLCSLSPRISQKRALSDPAVMTFNKPVDCATFANLGNGQPGEYGVEGWFMQFTASGAPSGSGTEQYSCNGREIRMNLTADFAPSTTNFWAEVSVGNVPDAKRSSYFRKPILVTKVATPELWESEAGHPFVFNSFASTEWGNKVDPVGSGGNTPPDQPPGTGGDTPSQPPTCTEDQVLVNNQCVPETDSNPPGSDQGGGSEDDGGGPEKACPGRTMTVDVSKGRWYQSNVSSSSSRKNSVKAGVHTYWANQPLFLRVRNNCQKGWYRMILTASNIDGPLPSSYKKFNVTVLKNDTTLGGINIKASDTEYNRGAMVVYLEKGDTDLNLLWTNDAYKQGEYDANINLADIALRYTRRGRYNEGQGGEDHGKGDEHHNHSSLRQAAQYCDMEGRWFWDGDSAYTYWANQSLKFCFPGLKAGRYRVQVEGKNHSDGLPLPAGYSSFQLALASGNSEAVLSIPASDDYRKGSTIMDLRDGDSITVTWKNDMYLEGSADANVQIHKIKLIPVDKGS